MKLNEQAQGIAGYQFLAGCNLFRREVPNRKSDRMSVDDFRRVVEYKLGMKLDREETLALFDALVPGTGDTVGIADMVRLLNKSCLKVGRMWRLSSENFKKVLLWSPAAVFCLRNDFRNFVHHSVWRPLLKEHRSAWHLVATWWAPRTGSVPCRNVSPLSGPRADSQRLHGLVVQHAR